MWAWGARDMRLDVGDLNWEELDTVYGSYQAAVYASDLAFRLVYANPGFETLVERPCREFVGKPQPYPFVASPVEDLIRMASQGLLQRAGVRAVDLLLCTPDGRQIRTIHTGVSLEIGEHQRGWLGVASTEPGDLALDGELTVLAAQTARPQPSSDLHRSRSELGGGGELSPRETQVAELLVQGFRVPSIARRLYISPHTVRNHIKSMLRKLAVSCQADLVETLNGNA